MKPDEEVTATPESIRAAYSHAIGMHNAESARYWDRNNVFILVNGGLLALLGIDLIAGFLDKVLICILGMISSYIWLLILIRGKEFIAKWSQVIKKMEGEYPEDLLPLFFWADESSLQRERSLFLPFSSYLASSIMNITCIMVFCTWLMGLIAVIVTSSSICYSL